VSDAKLDMLFEQIPPKLLSSLTAELKIDLKIVGLSVQQTKSDATRYVKLRVVEEYLERNFDVGWMTEPPAWFRGELSMHSGIYDDREEGLLLFTGYEESALVALIGSSYHLVGRRSSPETITLGYSFLPELFRLLELDHAERADRARITSHRVASAPPTGDNLEAVREVRRLDDQMLGPRQTCEFLARRLLVHRVADSPDLRTFVVGTPLYVALAEES